jgi:hypothetical protein
LRHLDSCISHDQAVTDVDVRPALTSSSKHALDLWTAVKAGTGRRKGVRADG